MFIILFILTRNTVKRQDLRKALGELLDEYGTLMDDTANIAALVIALTGRRSDALELLLALKDVDLTEEREPLLKDIDVSSLQEKFDSDSIPALLKRYHVLIDKVCQAVC
jgi:hypothetical protein